MSISSKQNFDKTEKVFFLSGRVMGKAVYIVTNAFAWSFARRRKDGSVADRDHSTGPAMTHVQTTTEQRRESVSIRTAVEAFAGFPIRDEGALGQLADTVMALDVALTQEAGRLNAAMDEIKKLTAQFLHMKHEMDDILCETLNTDMSVEEKMSEIMEDCQQHLTPLTETLSGQDSRISKLEKFQSELFDLQDRLAIETKWINSKIDTLSSEIKLKLGLAGTKTARDEGELSLPLLDELGARFGKPESTMSQLSRKLNSSLAHEEYTRERTEEPKVAETEPLRRQRDSLPAKSEAPTDAGPAYRGVEASSIDDDLFDNLEFNTMSERLIADEALRDIVRGDAETRLAAVCRLGKMRLPSLLPIFYSSLRDKNSLIRTECIKGAAATNDISVIPVLNQAFNDDASELVRITSLRCLCEFVKAGTAPSTLLIDALGDKSPLVRSRAARYIGWVNSREALPNLLVTLKDTSADVRKSVVETLELFGSPQSIVPLANALDDEAPDVRERVEKALRSIAGASPSPDEKNAKKAWMEIANNLKKSKSTQSVQPES